MDGGLNIRELFKDYGNEIDHSLRELFLYMPKYAMYGYMAYFMGFADENGKPIEAYGGKRFRSSMSLMLADWYGVKNEARPAALSLELFHNFTLIHDDIVDGDTFRRGRKTVWNVWGMPHAINTGDGQLMLAYRVLADVCGGDPVKVLEVQEFLRGQYQNVIEGQYLDFVLTDSLLGDDCVHEEAYFEMVGRKTAELIAGATKVVGVIASLSKEEADALYAYGYNLGIAYQLCDDSVSIWGTEDVTGKRAYGDVLERKKTLPILYAYGCLSDVKTKELCGYYNAKTTMTEAEAGSVVSLLDSVETYAHMSKLTDEYAKKAKNETEKLSLSTEQKQTLCEVVDALLPDIKAV